MDYLSAITTKTKEAEEMTQLVECLPYKPEA